MTVIVTTNWNTVLCRVKRFNVVICMSKEKPPSFHNSLNFK